MLGKYLIGKERYIVEFKFQNDTGVLNVWTDTDYAGCWETRKATSGGIIRNGEHLIKGWSATHKVIATSSGEAEYYGIVRGASEALGTRSFLEDMGIWRRIKLHEDSTAAKGVAEKMGLDRIKHIEVNQLWVRQKMRDKDIELNKVKGVDNLADALTKNTLKEKMWRNIFGNKVQDWERKT